MRPLILLLLFIGSARAEVAVTGRVVDSEGGGRAGVAIALWDGLAPERYLGRTRTDAEGRFRAVLDLAMLRGRSSPFGPVLLDASGAGLARTRKVVPLGARNVELVLVPAKRLSGLVADHTGRPVPGAVVTGRCLRTGVSEATTTSEEGRFILAGLPAGPVRLTALRDGIRVRSDYLGSGAVRLRFPKTALAQGRVVNAATSNPIAGAILDAGGEELGATGEQGRFRVALEKGRSITPAVLANGYAVARATLRGGGDPVEVRLVMAHPLLGRVVDSDGKGIEGVRVVITPPRLAVWTDEQGGYRFPIVPTGPLALRAFAPGYLPLRLEVAGKDAADRLTLKLLHGTRVSGTVVHAGRPLLGARVGVLADGKELAFGYADRAGRFQVAGIAVRGRRIVATYPGLRSPVLPLATPIRLELFDRLDLAGVVLSDIGRPVVGAAVDCGAAAVKTDAEGRFRFADLPVRRYELAVRAAGHLPLRAAAWPGEAVRLVARTRLGDLRLPFEVEADPGVRVRVTLRRREEPRIIRLLEVARGVFVSLAPGTYDLRAKVEGRLDAVAVVRLVAGRPATVHLRPARGGTVTLVAHAGAAVVVQTLSGREAPVAALDLQGGRRRLAGFGPGRYRFVSRAPGELIVLREIALGPSAPPVELDLRGGKQAVLDLKVVDPTGEPVEGAAVALVASGGFRWETHRRTDREGMVRLDRLFEGRVEIYVERGRRAGGGSVMVRPKAALRLTVVLGD